MLLGALRLVVRPRVDRVGLGLCHRLHDVAVLHVAKRQEGGRERDQHGYQRVEARFPGVVDGVGNGVVQDSVAQRGDLGAGQRGLVTEADQAGPGDQVSGGQHDFQPGGVGPEAVTRQVA